MREGEIELNDKTTIREMLTYIVTESGAMEAEASCFDDCVIIWHSQTTSTKGHGNQ